MHTAFVGYAFSVDRTLGNGTVDGVIGVDVYETDHENDYAVKNPNQIKSINNDGSFTDGNNIYHHINKQQVL